MGRKKQLISSIKDINIAKAKAGRLDGVKWEGHQYLVIRELIKGVDQRGRANEIVTINCVVIVKLKGIKPIIFQLKILKHVNIKGLVNLLKGKKAIVSWLIIIL